MADQQSIIALNIGSQRISMGVLAPTKKGLILKKYAATSILADPATEAARIPQVKLAIKELAKGLKVDKQKAAYALSGQSVFVRFVKLPPIEEDMDDLVRFEAQQNVPFPIDEVVWDWEKLETDGIEQEVVLVAIKADSLNDLNSVVADTGLGTRLVDSAPTALYNSFRYNYPGLEECVLLLDIGAKTSNLIYADGKKFFTRSVSIGGANITSAIAKEYNVSFVEAENSKLSSGLVTLGGSHADQLDDATAALGTVVRNALTRLTAEIQRTNTLFRSQQVVTPRRKCSLPVELQTFLISASFWKRNSTFRLKLLIRFSEFRLAKASTLMLSARKLISSVSSLGLVCAQRKSPRFLSILFLTLFRPSEILLAGSLPSLPLQPSSLLVSAYGLALR